MQSTSLALTVLIHGYERVLVLPWTASRQVCSVSRHASRKTLKYITFTDYVWGVVDMIPKTDFPDIRNRCAIHSQNGSCMIIPREGDVVRLYLQLSSEDAKEVINMKGRIDLTKWSPQRLMEIAKRNFKPFTIEFPDEVQWWTLYISA